MISIESPFVLKSSTDADLLCEVRDCNYQSILWRCLVPKHGNPNHSGFISVPADIVPFIHDESYSFTVTALARESPPIHEVELVSELRKEAIEISAPAPFSPQSFRRGVIDEKEVVLSAINPQDDITVGRNSERVNLSVCSVRIGSLSSGVRAATEVPEQRMILFRSPLVLCNFLSLPIAVQVRVKLTSETTSEKSPRALPRDANFLDWEGKSFIIRLYTLFIPLLFLTLC